MPTYKFIVIDVARKRKYLRAIFFRNNMPLKIRSVYIFKSLSDLNQVYLIISNDACNKTSR